MLKYWFVFVFGWISNSLYFFHNVIVLKFKKVIYIEENHKIQIKVSDYLIPSHDFFILQKTDLEKSI